MTARFAALRPASRRNRLLLFLFGPVMWVAALVVLAFVLDRRDAVEFAVAVFALSFLAGVIILGFARFLRSREERQT